ncbi:hypothetical protein, partial [Schleiferia thermophila]
VRFAPVLRCAAHRPAGALRIPHAIPPLPEQDHTPPHSNPQGTNSANQPEKLSHSQPHNH